MIYINSRPADMERLSASLPDGGLEGEMLSAMADSPQRLDYPSDSELLFELALRESIVRSSIELYNARLPFAVFRKSRCNEKYWLRTPDGGFRLKEGVSGYEAIIDIYKNSRLYATECATAMVIVYFGALTRLYEKELFDKAFEWIYLMDWHNIHPLLKEVGFMQKEQIYLPGDRRYIANPDVNPETPEWQGENVIDLSGGQYYGHGIGVGSAEMFINGLNQNRIPGSTRSAYLMQTVGLPSFKRLYQVAVSG